MKQRHPLKVALLFAGLAVLLVLFRHYPIQGFLKTALAWTQQLGFLASFAFILLYILACVLLIPGSILTLGAGIVFGVIKGSIIVSIAATLGATAAFLIGRYWARDWVSRKIEGNVKFKAVDEAVAKEGWKIVLLMRLSPAFPFNLLNYAFGLSPVSLKHYFLASWLGMLPGTVLYVYIGSLAGNLAALGAGGSRSRSLWEWAFYASGMAATMAATFYATRLARRALGQRGRP